MNRTMIDPWAVRRALAESAGFYRLVVLDRTSSTSDVARDAASRGLPEGIVVIADEQTACRGQHGRRWLAPAGENLLLSVLLRPRLPIADAFLLSAIAATSVASAIESTTGIRQMLKWPNDVLSDYQKVAGILVETVITDCVDTATVGIGLNANWSPTDLGSEATPATSLREQAGRRIDRTQLTSSLLWALQQRYRSLLAGNRRTLWLEWRARLVEPGRRITVRDEKGLWTGEAQDVLPTGELIVVDETGTRNKLAFGQATIRLDHQHRSLRA